jgi:hypothetical protein
MVSMMSVPRSSTTTASTIATPANQSVRQKLPDLDKEDFATCQSYPYMQLRLIDSTHPHGNPDGKAKEDGDLST